MRSSALSYVFQVLILLLCLAGVAHAATYTYKYVGPTFLYGTDHVEINFTTSAPLAPARSYIKTSDAGVISSSLTVVGANGTVSGFTLPLSTFQLHTNASASVTTPGIDSWDILGDISNLTGASPATTGTHFQSYSMNTMTFIPGSDIPGAVGLVTGHYNYDQATETTFYTSCSAAPAGLYCALAGNGQPYVGNYSGIINPANTSSANWTITANAVNPPPPVSPLSLSGLLPSGSVGQNYQGSLTATGGTLPYTWNASGLPAGLAIDSASGIISGLPTTAGSFSGITITVTDALAVQMSSSVVLVVTSPLSCSGANAPISGVNKYWLDVNGGLSGGGQSIIYASAANTTFTAGTTTFLVGELIDYAGTVDAAGMCAAASMTVKPASQPLTLIGTLPGGVVGQLYQGTLTAAGGSSPYSWSATGLPSGLSVNPATGTISGIPTTAGNYSCTVKVTDSKNANKSLVASLVVSTPPPTYSCTKPAGAKAVQVKARITSVGAGFIVVGAVAVQTPPCTTISWNGGAKAFAVGQTADYQGYKTASGVTVAQKITIN